MLRSANSSSASSRQSISMSPDDHDENTPQGQRLFNARNAQTVIVTKIKDAAKTVSKGLSALSKYVSRPKTKLD